MWTSIWIAVKGLLESKKFFMAMIALMVWGLGKAGFHASNEELLPFVVPIWVAIFGQGVADIGKPAAQVAAAAASAKPPLPLQPISKL